MLDPVKLANDVRSIESSLSALSEAVQGINRQTSKDLYFIKHTLEETKYTHEQIKFELRELKNPIDAILACLKSILWFVRVVSIAALVGAILLAGSCFNGLEQLLIFSDKVLYLTSGTASGGCPIYRAE